MEKKEQNVEQQPQQPAAPSAVAGGEQPGSGDGGGDDGSGNSRLLNNLPAFLMDYYGSKHNAPSGMVPLHWQEGREEMDELVTEVRGRGRVDHQCCTRVCAVVGHGRGMQSSVCMTWVRLFANPGCSHGYGAPHAMCACTITLRIFLDKMQFCRCILGHLPCA